ncbi:MAG: SAM-dependent methyltransferase [Betaproteobacteria bacterium]|nr:SAM-dependent methyltransferase [Betaproteobacteria bacterium]
MSLPEPSSEAREHSARVAARIKAEIEAGGGWISFARYMELALYAPGLGYYMAGARKLGRDGDFVTAPEISDLFGQTLAQQVRQVLAADCDEVLEVGAGSGALAASLLAELDRLGALPARYLILELSPDLRSRSRDTLAERVPHLLERVAWLNQLPPSFSGCVLGNEVLDAMPVHVICREGESLREQGVALAGEGFGWAARPLPEALRSQVDASCFPEPGYCSEIQFVARSFVHSVGKMLERGVALFIDYGFPRREYYHPQRARGTLMCHYRHHAHDDPFFLPGLQDITSHIDFTAMAQAAGASGLELLGYGNQAQFLINCGITDLLARTPASDARAYPPLAAQVQKLTSPAEMGELFKVIALGRGDVPPLLGFARGDKRHML